MVHEESPRVARQQAGFRYVLGLVLILTGILSVREAQADFRFHEGNFTSPTTAAPPDQVQSVIGVGFKPKAIIFFTGENTTGNVSSVHTSYGFTSGPANNEAIALDAQWNNPTGDGTNFQSQTDCILFVRNSATLPEARAHLTSFDTDGFTLTWTFDSLWRSGALVHYIALGGTDLTNAVASNFTATTGAGTQSVTGLGFKPDFMIFISIGQAAMGAFTANGQANIGFASSPSAQAGIGATTTPEGQTPAASGTWVRQRTDNAIVELTAAGAQDKLAAVQSFDPNGFTINKTASATATAIHYLALKGGAYKVGSFNKSTGVAPVSQPVSGVGFKPIGLLLASKDKPSNAAIENDARISLGASDGTNYGAIWFHDLSGGCSTVSGNCSTVGNTGTQHRISTTRIIEHATVTASAGVSVYAAATLTSFDANGFTLNWASNNAALDEILYVAFGAATPVYYSVGTSYPTNLMSGSPTVTLVSGTATFSLAQSNNIGVGDEVTYNGGTKAYISGRTSSTVYSLETATGVVPLDVAGAPVNSITRAFGSLNAAVAGSTDASHLNASDLVAANIQLNWSCYNDGPLNDGGIDITGYTTGPAHYIRIFTPTSASEVGTSQRHAGKAGTGFRLRPIIDLSSPPVTWYSVLHVFVNYMRIEGTEIDGSQITQAAGLSTLRIDLSVSPTADIRIDKVIIHDITNSSRDQATNAYSPYGIELQQGISRVSDSIIYAVHNFNNNASSDTHGIRVSSNNTATVYIFNNTIYDIANMVAAGGLTTGISRSGSSTATVTVKNTVALNVTSVGGSPTCFGGTMTQSNNVSSDATASGAGSQINKTSYASYFASVAAGSENFHLLNNSNVLWAPTAPTSEAMPACRSSTTSTGRPDPPSLTSAPTSPS